MLSVTTNLASLIVQSNLRKSTNGLNAAIERMTTGFKINGAKDNAANHSIVTDMSTKISAYEVAEENVSMGLDMVSTASDMLDQINDRLARLRALQEQAANGTYGEDSLMAINKEVNALVDEIIRLYNTAEYNGKRLFGEVKKSTFLEEITVRDTDKMTAFESVDENITISGGTYSISTAEELAKLATMTNNGKISGGEFVLTNDINLSGYSTGEGWMPIGTEMNPFSASFDGNGYVISNLYIDRPTECLQGLFGSITNSSIKNIGVENVNIVAYRGAGGLFAKGTAVEITNSYASGTVNAQDMAGGLIGAVVNSGNISNCYADIDVIGFKALGTFVADAVINFNGTNITITNCYALGQVLSEYQTEDLFIGIEHNDPNRIVLSSGNVASRSMLPFAKADTSISDDIIFQVGINSDNSSQILLNSGFSLDSIEDLCNIGLNGIDYLRQIDNLLSVISEKQVEYGAVQNRLESVLEEINIQYENLVSSRSTLRDADVAEESSAYIRNQILQEAAATLLATANQSPAIALQLL